MEIKLPNLLVSVCYLVISHGPQGKQGGWAAVVRILAPMPNYCSRGHENKCRKDLGYQYKLCLWPPHFHAIPHRTFYRYNKIGDINMKESRKTSTHIFFSLLLRDKEELEIREKGTREVPFPVFSLQR